VGQKAYRERESGKGLKKKGKGGGGTLRTAISGRGGLANKGGIGQVAAVGEIFDQKRGSGVRGKS